MDNLTHTQGEDTVNEESVFLQLKGMIARIIGDDVAEIVGIQKDSIFTKDLEMDSIQIVTLAEMIQEKYGQRIDFVTWLTKKSIFKLINLRVGDVVELIVKGK
jgi:acyl carrier protein